MVAAVCPLNSDACLPLPPVHGHLPTLRLSHLVSLPAHMLFRTGPPYSQNALPKVGGQEHATAFPEFPPFPLLPSPTPDLVSLKSH